MDSLAKGGRDDGGGQAERGVLVTYRKKHKNLIVLFSFILPECSYWKRRKFKLTSNLQYLRE